MSRFLTSFWRQPESAGSSNGPEPEGSSATQSAATGAASWITMKDPAAGSRGEPVMAVNQATVEGVLEPLGDEGAVNLVAIFGAARGGKSFLMNQLAGQDDIFKISNDKDPCTQGVDVSRAVVPLGEFATLDGCTAPREASAGNKVRVLFADVEGQGDRDAAYDARLASAILPLTKCVIFNWRDSLQVDRMLNLLGVMQRAAHNVDLGDDGDGAGGPKFGHLHVVFRDWNYSGTAEDVKKQLFGLDHRALGAEAAVKNELRRTIQAAFASVTVWLFPAPVVMTSELSKELKAEDLSEGFVSQLSAFRSALTAQLSKPTVFGRVNPITGHSLGSLVPALVEVLNNGEIIMPQSAYQQMLAMEAEQVKKTYLAKADALIKTGMGACDNGPPVPPKHLEGDMEEEIQALLAGFESEAKGIGAKEDATAEAVQEIRASLERGMQGLRAHNRTALARHLKAGVKNARASFTAEFTDTVRRAMPLPPLELASSSAAAASRARTQLTKIPTAGPEDDSLEEALSAFGEFVELAVSKAERENDALTQAQGAKEEEALATAILAFQRELTTDLSAVKTGGGPYKFSSVEAAGKAALAGASAALRRALSPGDVDGEGLALDGPLSDRVAVLVGRLGENSRMRIVQERSEFDRSCSAFMMRLGTEERRRLREETETDVYPLLPLCSAPELESAFKPVVQRMNDRIETSARGWSLPEEMQAQYMDSAKSDAESVWQSLYERNERLKLQRENAEVGANAQRQQMEAQELRNRLGEERRRVVEAEGSARDATEAAATARLAATEANQRARQAVGAREREAAAREQEKREEEARRAEERQRAAAERARSAAEAAAREAALVAATKKAAQEAALAAATERAAREAERAAERAAAAEKAAAAKKAAAAAEKAAAAAKREAAAERAAAAAEKAAAAERAAAAEKVAAAERAAAAAEKASAAAAAEKASAVAAAAAAAVKQAEEDAAAAAAKQAEEDAAVAAAKQAEEDAAAAAAAAAAKQAEEDNNVEGFEDAMSVENEEEEQREEAKPNRGKRSARDEEEEEEEEGRKKKVLRTSGRRRTILTPVGKDPAALKRAREEAAQKIREVQEAKAGKGALAKEEEEEEEEEDTGMSEIEKSRMRAKDWAKEQKAKKTLAAKKKKETAAKPEPAASAAAAGGSRRRAPTPRKK